MNTIKKNKGGKLNISDKKIEVDPPKGHHWMIDRGRYFLMKGDYKPHEAATPKAEFKLVSHK
jgi:hypothetical protein|tara:strand:+ start:38 stop:223 length:186 start_codon:yes stop_codon:yes gene_type:complete